MKHDVPISSDPFRFGEDKLRFLSFPISSSNVRRFPLNRQNDK